MPLSSVSVTPPKHKNFYRKSTTTRPVRLTDEAWQGLRNLANGRRLPEKQMQLLLDLAKGLDLSPLLVKMHDCYEGTGDKRVCLPMKYYDALRDMAYDHDVRMALLASTLVQEASALKELHEKSKS